MTLRLHDRSMLDQAPSIACRSTSSRSAVAAFFSGAAARLRRPVAAGSYNAEIDGLRFIAIAIVVIGHFMERAVRFFPVARSEIDAAPLGSLLLRPGLGVYLFFAVSGFVITRQAIKARQAPLSPGFLKAYFGRRVLRIEPPYLILLVATWALIMVSGYRPDQTNHFDAVPHSMTMSLAGSVVYMHDLIWGTYPRLFPPGWSLEIEVQFYVLAPLLFFTLFALRSVAARTFVGIVGLVASTLLSCVAPDQLGAVHTETSILRFFHYFWLGMLLALAHGWIVERAGKLPPVVASGLGWLGLVAYLAMPPGAPDLAVAMLIRAATLVALTAMFVSAFAGRSSFRAFCARPWISVIGGACYSFYLTHLQAIQAMTSVLAKLTPQAGIGTVVVYLVIEVVAVIVVGMTFYVLIERTFMLKDWPRRFQIWLKGQPAPWPGTVRVPRS